jgi:hypothetical protein
MLPLCEHCQRPSRQVFQQGDGALWCKFCHHDRKFAGVNLDHTHFRPDAYPGGPITLENYGQQPVTFSCESERQAYMQKHELEQRERWCPFPGTDRDPAGVQNPEGYVDDVTLKNRAELFLRAHTAGGSTDVSERAMGGTFRGPLTHRDALAVATGTDVTRQSRVGRRLKEQEDA